MFVKFLARTTMDVYASAERSRTQGTLWPGVGTVMVVAAFTALYWPIASGLIAEWQADLNYSHGFLVPFFSLILIWRRRSQLVSAAANGAWIGFLALLGGVCMLVLGNIGGEDFLTRSSLIVVLAGLVLFLFGQGVFRLVAFPLGFLLLMIPPPQILFNAITFPLQSVAALTAANALELLGVPVLLDGHVMHLSQISLGVTEACSGIRSLISLLTVAVAWAHLTLSGVWRSIAFVAAVFPITILANAGRVISTGLIAEWLGAEYAEGFLHGLAGWLVFMLAFLCLLGIHLVIRVPTGRTRSIR